VSAYEPFGEQDYQWFVSKVQARFNVRLSDYKPEQMRRRLASLASRCEQRTFVEYFSSLERDGARLGQFLDEMTINVTELLRNPSLFETLMSEVLSGRYPSCDGREFRVWSAGCSYGAEAYTLAMLLHELSPRATFKIMGTDLDLSVLAKANNPRFTKEDMANLTEAQRSRHFLSVDGATYFPHNHLRDKVSFSPHDLLGTSYPVNQYDLILCRNVLIYFTDEAKDWIYRNLFQALKPGGVLFVGGTERLADHTSAGFTLLRPFFYEKPKEKSLRAA